MSVSREESHTQSPSDWVAEDVKRTARSAVLLRTKATSLSRRACNSAGSRRRCGTGDGLPRQPSAGGLPYGPKAAQHYGAIRVALENRGQPIGVNDLHIAGPARSEGLILVTNNMSEFVRAPALEVENSIPDGK